MPHLYRDLRERIVTVELVPGEAVSESRIAESYGVSRTPVREAFKRLAEDGFLDVLPQVGTFVARIDLAVVRDNQFVRETLECRLVVLAAERIDDRGKAMLRGNIALQKKALAEGDRATFFAADEAMHEAIAAIAGHPSVWLIIDAAKAQLDRVRHLSLASVDRSKMRMNEHRVVVERLIAGDGVGAADAMRRHLRSIFEAIETIAAHHEHYFIDPNPLRP